MKKIAIGVDIGGTNTVIGIVDEAGNVLIKDSISTPSHGDFEQFIADLTGAIKSLIKSVNLLHENLDLKGIGIGAPVGNYNTGTIDYATNLSFKGKLPICDLLRSHFPDIPAIVLTNDANAAAMGEMIYGGAKGIKNFVLFTLGTGVGS